MELEQREPMELRAIRSLGLGFDLTSDFRLRFAKGCPGKRLELEEKNTGDLVFPGGFTAHSVPSDIGCDKGDLIRFCSVVYKFNQISSDYNLADGLRLYLEGPKSNQLAIHIQHLSSLPSMFASVTSCFSMWQSSEDSGHNFFEPIRWKSCSRVCTAAVKHDTKWFDIVSDGVFVVTGAQLVTRGRWLKKCLHLRLLFSHIPNCSIQKTEWSQAPSHARNGSLFTSFSTALTSAFTHH